MHTDPVTHERHGATPATPRPQAHGSRYSYLSTAPCVCLSIPRPARTRCDRMDTIRSDKRAEAQFKEDRMGLEDLSKKAEEGFEKAGENIEKAVETAKDKAAEVAGDVKDKATEVAEDLKDKFTK